MTSLEPPGTSHVVPEIGTVCILCTSAFSSSVFAVSPGAQSSRRRGDRFGVVGEVMVSQCGTGLALITQQSERTEDVMAERTKRFVEWGLVVAGAFMMLALGGCDLGDKKESDPDPGPGMPLTDVDAWAGPFVDVGRGPGAQPGVPEGDPEDGPPGDSPEPILSAAPFADAVLSADGNYLLTQVEFGADRCLAVVDVGALTVTYFDQLCGLRWIAVDPDAPLAYVLEGSGSAVSTVELATMTTGPHYLLSDEYGVLDVAPDGSVCTASNRPANDFDAAQYEWNTTFMPFRHLGVIHLASGTVHEQTFPYAIRSLAFSPQDQAVLVAVGWWGEDGLPTSFVHWMNPVTGVVEADVSFPNCVAELVVRPGGTQVIMSPTVCFVHPIGFEPEEVVVDEVDVWTGGWESWGGDDWDEWDSDPASIIDLVTREYVGNVPGYGPIAFSPDGETAVGFTRQDTMMKQWNYFQKENFGIILIRTADLYWQVVEYGDTEPDFFVSPDGTLCLHDREGGVDRVVRMSLDEKVPSPLTGPEAHLRGRAVAAGGEVIHSVYDGELRRIALLDHEVETLELPIQLGQVFSRPLNDLLVATDADTAKVLLIDPDSGSILDSIDL